ncbi:hypothetical protein DB30_01383 [Enhygromyxa salina]|uniref:Uncharacterized protein n=1 Tax=Enhygromyxa salina TaxID=215803 RepID=A0A0C1ZL69_9BACT|nr:hypothetical protein [Enhygromyxa salina]KIG18274.1 hypothetical protein DB30_01383 [Enhygromyxa salina]
MDQLIACLAVVGFVVALFFFGDRLLAGDRKRELGGWLIDELPAEARVDALPKAFIEWFDQLFRTRSVRVFGAQIQLPSFWRSALASFLALCAASVVWIANKGGFSQPPTSTTNLSLLLLLYGGATVVTNIIPDYLSLVESRFVLGKMSQTRSLLGKLAWLAVDVVATAAIVFCFLWGSAYLLLPLVPEDSLYAVGCLTRDSFDLDRMIDIAIAGLTFSTPPGTINYDVSGIYIFSSFFTSFWVWLYLGSSLLVRLAQLIPGLRGFLRRACRVQDYPLRVLAVVSGIVAFGLFLLPSLVNPLLPASRRGTNGMDGNIGQIALCMDMRAKRLGLSDAGYWSAAPPPANFDDLGAWSAQLQVWTEARRHQLALEQELRRWAEHAEFK